MRELRAVTCAPPTTPGGLPRTQPIAAPAETKGVEGICGQVAQVWTTFGMEVNR
jgi:hypothetical protein